jgi:hypothetical protein
MTDSRHWASVTAQEDLLERETIGLAELCRNLRTTRTLLVPAKDGIQHQLRGVSDMMPEGLHPKHLPLLVSCPRHHMWGSEAVSA